MCFIYNCVPNQILFDHCTGYPKKYDKKYNNKIPNIENVNNNPAWISTYLQSRHQRRLARTGYLWLPEPRPRVAELQPPSDGSGSRARSRRLDPSADTNHTGSKLRWKIYLSVIENGEYVQPIFCISIQSLPPPMIYVSLNQALNQDLYGVLFPSTYYIEYDELFFKILKNLLSSRC